MKRRLSVVLVLVVVLALLLAIPVSAKKPLEGDMELYFNLGFGNPEAPCPGLTWAGTVELDGVVYGMAFYPTGEKDVGKVHHYWEDWYIYDTPFEFMGGAVLDECVPGEIVLAGTDKGVFSPNIKYRMSGTVDQAAEPFEEWLGRRVYMAGIGNFDPITGAPVTAPGTFRLN